MEGGHDTQLRARRLPLACATALHCTATQRCLRHIDTVAHCLKPEINAQTAAKQPHERPASRGVSPPPHRRLGSMRGQGRRRGGGHRTNSGPTVPHMWGLSEAAVSGGGTAHSCPQQPSHAHAAGTHRHQRRRGPSPAVHTPFNSASADARGDSHAHTPHTRARTDLSLSGVEFRRHGEGNGAGPAKSSGVESRPTGG